MELNKELYDRIQETAQTQVLKIGNKEYTTNKVHLVEDPIYKPEAFCLNTLCGICKMIKTEISKIKERPLIVHVEDYNRVCVYTTYDDRFVRTALYHAVADVPRVTFGSYQPHESFMIELRSKYLRNEDTDYLLRLLASVVDENSVKTSDNGLSQKVEVQQGITTIGTETVRPIVKLRPYRTFLEVEQPESEFLVRLQEGGKIALFEADGGMWKLEAKRNIASFLAEELEELEDMIGTSGSVIITE